MKARSRFGFFRKSAYLNFYVHIHEWILCDLLSNILKTIKRPCFPRFLLALIKFEHIKRSGLRHLETLTIYFLTDTPNIINRICSDEYYAQTLLPIKQLSVHYKVENATLPETPEVSKS